MGKESPTMSARVLLRIVIERSPFRHTLEIDVSPQVPGREGTDTGKRVFFC